MKKATLLIVLIGVLALGSVALQAKIAGALSEIFINPNPMDKFTTITLTFTQYANVGVNIETEQGVVIKSLYWGPAGEQLQLTWNRLDDNGNVVPSGNYVVVVNHEARYTSTKKTLILK